MMRKSRNRKPMSIDLDHMRVMHEEAVEQLELMYSAVEAAEHATDAMRDSLDDMAVNHWRAYLDVVHMICMHDEPMGTIMKKFGMIIQDEESETEEHVLGAHRILLLLLLLALTRRHNRVIHIFAMHGDPMNEYLNESLIMEREHMANIIAMVESII